MNARLCWSMLLCCGPFAAPALAQAPAPEHLLRMAFLPGATHCYRKTMTWRAKVGDAPATVTVMAATIESSSIEIQDDKALVRETVRRVVCKVQREGEKTPDMDYDSDTTDQSRGYGLGRVVDKEIRMKLDSLGRCSDLSAPEELSKAYSTVLLLVQGPVLPDTPVRVGATWESVATMPYVDPSDRELVVTDKLLAVDKGKATIQVAVKLDRLPDRGIKVERYDGTTVIDLATGRVLSAQSDFVWSRVEARGEKTAVSFTTKLEEIEPPKRDAAAQPEARPAKGKEDTAPGNRGRR